MRPWLNLGIIDARRLGCCPCRFKKLRFGDSEGRVILLAFEGYSFGLLLCFAFLRMRRVGFGFDVTLGLQIWAGSFANWVGLMALLVRKANSNFLWAEIAYKLDMDEQLLVWAIHCTHHLHQNTYMNALLSFSFFSLLITFI